MDNIYNALLRTEGANSCPTEGWEKMEVEGLWVWELPECYPDLKQSVFEALSSVESGSFRVVLHLTLSDKATHQPLLIDPELAAFLGSKGVEIEVYAMF